MKKNIVKSVITSAVAILFLMLTFKKLRIFFPPPEISNEKLIGFAQYFGYPFYFDTLIFFLIIFLPILILFIFSVKKLMK